MAARKRRRPAQLELEAQTAPENPRPQKKRRRNPRRREERRRFAAVEGDRLPAVIAGATGFRFAEYVLARCRSSAGRAWLCLSCGQYLVNETQRDFHTETGAHVLARVCPDHGAEAPRRREL